MPHVVHKTVMLSSSPLLQAALKRLLTEGHELGSHAAEHVRLSQLTPAQAQQQIEWAIGNISTVTGSKSVPVSRCAAVGAGAPLPHHVCVVVGQLEGNVYGVYLGGTALCGSMWVHKHSGRLCPLTKHTL